VPAAELAGQTFLFVEGLPAYWIEAHHPAPGDVAGVPGFQEMLAYVIAGRGLAVVGAQTERLYPRPDLACVPLQDAPPFTYALVWRTGELPPAAAALLAAR
jgi:hypothetical protein